MKKKSSTFTIRLNKAMKSRKVGPAAIVKATGLSFSTMHYWTSGKTLKPRVDERMVKLAKFLKMPVRKLVF